MTTTTWRRFGWTLLAVNGTAAVLNFLVFVVTGSCFSLLYGYMSTLGFVWTAEGLSK